MADEKKETGFDPRYASYPQEFHKFWPKHVIKAGLLVILIISGLSVLSYMYQLPAVFGETFPDAGEYIPSPEWYFLFVFQPFWYLTGESKEWLYIGTFVIPALVLLFLILVPFIFRKKKAHKKGFLPKLLAMSGPVLVYLLLFTGIYRSGAPAKVQSCVSCHTPQYGQNQYLPPMNMIEYYNVHRKAQIAVGKYRASKVDEAGDAAVGGAAETYKDANWQLRHVYEPTFTW